MVEPDKWGNAADAVSQHVEVFLDSGRRLGFLGRQELASMYEYETRIESFWSFH